MKILSVKMINGKLVVRLLGKDVAEESLSKFYDVLSL